MLSGLCVLGHSGSGRAGGETLERMNSAVVNKCKSLLTTIWALYTMSLVRDGSLQVLNPYWT